MLVKKTVAFVKNVSRQIHWWQEYVKVRDHCHYAGNYRGAAHSICNFKYSIPKEIPIAFHKGSNYDYHFITKVLAKEFKSHLSCLGENLENLFISDKKRKLKELAKKEKILNQKSYPTN